MQKNAWQNKKIKHLKTTKRKMFLSAQKAFSVVDYKKYMTVVIGAHLQISMLCMGEINLGKSNEGTFILKKILMRFKMHS